jgi:hypothetical protein
VLSHWDGLHDSVEMSSVVAAEEVVAPVVGAVQRGVVVGVVFVAGDEGEFVVGDYKMNLPLKSSSEVFEL